MSDSSSGADIWVLADDRAGNVGQCLGVAEALGVPFQVKTVRYDRFARMPNLLRGATLWGVTRETRLALVAPWPRLVIAAGRRTAPVARWIKRHSVAALVQIMDPGPGGRGEFDLIAIPRHDGGNGAVAANVLPVTGAPHRMTPAVLAAAAETWRPRFAGLPHPWLGLIVGGSTRKRPFTPSMAAELGRRVADLASAAGGSVLVTTSRRTGQDAERTLLETIPEPRFVHRWGSAGENPYAGFLALADALVVTGDSVSMVCEACAAPAPVYVYAPSGWVVEKHARLHRQLYAEGLAQPLMSVAGLEAGAHPSLNAATEIARVIRERLL